MNLWRPCQGAGCGGAHKPAVMRRAQFSDPADPRSNYSHLAYTDFPPANYIWQPQYDDIFANGDGQYVYPCEHAGAAGTGGPCATVRLAAIRDGLEDWELFARLGAKQAAPLLRRLVRSPTDWTEDAALLEATRREAAAMLDAQLAARTQKRRNAAVPAVPAPDAAGSAAAPAVPAPDAAGSAAVPAVPAPDAAGSSAVPAVPAPDAAGSAAAPAVPAVPAPDAAGSAAAPAVPTPDAADSAAVPAAPAPDAAVPAPVAAGSGVAPAVPAPDATGSAAAPEQAAVPAPDATGDAEAVPAAPASFPEADAALNAPQDASAGAADAQVGVAPAASKDASAPEPEAPPTEQTDAQETPQPAEREVIQDPVERLRVNKERLVAFYRKVEPSRMHDDHVDRVLIEYSLPQLADALTNKYGSAPLFVLR